MLTFLAGTTHCRGTIRHMVFRGIVLCSKYCHVVGMEWIALQDFPSSDGQLRQRGVSILFQQSFPDSWSAGGLAPKNYDEYVIRSAQLTSSTGHRTLSDHMSRNVRLEPKHIRSELWNNLCCVYEHLPVRTAFRHRASCILEQAFHYSPVNAFYIFNQQLYFIIWYLLDRASLI